MPMVILVPLSSWMSRRAPRRMMETLARRGSCWPGALLARRTPGTEVMVMLMPPFWATTVPGAGGPPAAALLLAAGDAGEPGAAEAWTLVPERGPEPLAGA